MSRLEQLTGAQQQMKCKMINNIRLYKNTVSTLVEHSSTQLINTEHRKVSLNTYIYTVYIDIYRKADLLWGNKATLLLYVRTFAIALFVFSVHNCNMYFV